VRRLEPAAITGVMSREVANFRTFWKATTFSSVLEPIIYLVAFGIGLGSTVVDRVDGLEYVEFVGTGMVATAVIFSSALPAMFGTFVKYKFQNTYDAILAAPVDVEELVTAEMLWISYVTTLFVTPLFLVAGTFFPIDDLPPGFRAAAQLNPLHHLVELVRHASFGFEATDLIRIAVLMAFATVLWRVAVRRMTARLID